MVFNEIKVEEDSYPILFVPLQGSMEKIPGHLLIFIQPHDDKWLKPATEIQRTSE